MASNEVTNQPRRAMGFRDLVLFYVVTGISLRWIATAATAGPSAITIWLIAWLAFYLPFVLSVVELSSRYPQEGGLYVWAKQAFGDFAGFMNGWIYWCSNLPYFPSLLYFTASVALYAGPPSWHRYAGNKTYFVLFSLGGLALATALNIVGLSVGKWLHNLGAIGTWLPIGILYAVAIACWWKFGSATSFHGASLIPHAGSRDVLFWASIIFALSGAESASFLGDEVKEPRRNIPRALLIAGVVVTTGYILGTVAMLVALPASEVSGLEGIMQAISTAGSRAGIGGLGPIAAVLIVVSNLGALGAWLAAAARLPFVAGIDKYLPPTFAKVHPKWGTPYVALLVHCAVTTLVIFLGQAGTSIYGAYEVLVGMGIIASFIPYLMIFASLLRLHREPAGRGVVRIPGGKKIAMLVGVVGVVTSIVTIVLSTVPGPDEPHPLLAVAKLIGLTLVLIISGAGVFRWGKRWHRETRVAS